MADWIGTGTCVFSMNTNIIYLCWPGLAPYKYNSIHINRACTRLVSVIRLYRKQWILESITMENIVIRAGCESDCESLMTLIRELAEYEGMPDQVKITEDDLKRSAFQSSPPVVYTVVAEISHPPSCSADSASKTIAGYALYYNTYSTWKGKAIHLEDIYVRSEYRFQGIGEKLLKYIAKIVRNGDYARISFECINWNESAIKFYKKHGADDVTIKDHWHSYRFGNEAMKKLASSARN